MKSLALPLLLIPLGLSACSTSANRSPSLLPRAIEAKGKAMLEEPPLETVALAASDANRVAQVQASLERAQSTIGPFRDAIAAARSTTSAARGSLAGSESWVQAMMAIARAEAVHGPTVQALTELGEFVGIVVFGPPSSDEATVIGAVQQVEAIDRMQRSEIAALYAALGV